MSQSIQVLSVPERRSFVRAWFDAFAYRFPFTTLLLVLLISNIAATFFNFFYNTILIVRQDLTDQQQEVFWNQAAPLYNTVAWPVCFAVIVYTLLPLIRCHRMLRSGEPIDPEFLLYCRRRLINFPLVQIVVNLIGWLPGAIIFPWLIVALGGPEFKKPPGEIWGQFAVSFLVGAIFTTVQTYFLLQAYLLGYLYPEFFKGTRPESIPGGIRIPFIARLIMLWAAVALMPMIALLAVTLKLVHPDRDEPIWFPIGLVIISAITGGTIFWLMGRDLWRWIHLQTEATDQIAQGNFDIRIDQPRPDEWGRLTNYFNDMATSLGQAWESHETLGQLVSPEVRDQILRRMQGFEVEVQEITVLFVDIRGFTPRCAGASPEKIGALLNSFLTLALRSIEEKGGYVNKFLGDGVMALFGATHAQPDHADLALASACEMLVRLEELNAELTQNGEPPIVIGIGIHTGEALVGCFGATVQGDQGQPLMRREFTAIGETVNFCQRIEQLTKRCGGPILLTENTRTRLVQEWLLICLGPQELPGAPQPMVVYKADMG